MASAADCINYHICAQLTTLFTASKIALSKLHYRSRCCHPAGGIRVCNSKAYVLGKHAWPGAFMSGCQQPKHTSHMHETSGEEVSPPEHFSRTTYLQRQARVLACSLKIR